MSSRVDFRLILAAAIVLAVLAGAYQLAPRWPIPKANAGLPVAPSVVAQSDAVAGPPRRAKAAAGPAAPPLPALYTVPGLLSGALLLPERANTPERYRPHPLPLTFSRVRVVAHVRRYAGQAGPYQVSAELTWQRPDSVAGSGYLGHHERVFRVGTDRRRAYLGRTVLTLVQTGPDRAAGTWQLSGWPGPVLTGTWVDASGHPRRLRLREHYAGAVPYDIERLVLQGGKPDSEYPEDVRVPRHYQEYLHLVGAAARRPALRRWQAPPLAVRRRQLLATYERGRTYGGIDVRLNDDYLLSYEATYLSDEYEGRPQPGVRSLLIDLATGRALTLASQLRPGYTLPLRRLLTRQLLADTLEESDTAQRIAQLLRAKARPGAELLVALPLSVPESLTDEDLVLTDEGLEAIFSDVAVLGNLWSRQTPTVVISYAELRPLVRPGTPLARLLRARGLW